MGPNQFDDELLAQILIPFPCYAIRSENGRGYVVEPIDDNTNAMVILTDEDMVQRYLTERNLQHREAVAFNNAVTMLRELSEAPPAVTHVTLDPSYGVFRRIPIDHLRLELGAAIREGRAEGD